MKTSTVLVLGKVYTREDLRTLFGVSDATINTGVFHPKGHDSVWLFVTERKTPDRTQFADKLEGDILYWQGQTSGRTDQFVIEHDARGLELLVFYRREKYEFPKAGFRYEGAFIYVSHTGTGPASFILRKADLSEVEEVRRQAETEHAFDPTNTQDARIKTLAAIVRRQGQGAFRQALMKAYAGRCAVTGYDFPEVLEAAHIYPYMGMDTNHVTNGLLLRADIHTLFDLGYLSIDPGSRKVRVAASLLATVYSELDGRNLHEPADVAERPSKEALAWHFGSAHIT